MDIQKTLAALNIDMSDPEAVKGATDAIKELLKTEGPPTWPPPPPPPPTNPPLPKPPKKGKKDIDGLKRRKPRRNGPGEGSEDQPDLTDDEIRSIRYNRALEAAKATLDAAEKANADPDKIAALKAAIADLEQLTESVGKRSVRDLSQEEFDSVINNVLTAIHDLGILDDELQIDSEDEHNEKVKRLEDVLADDSIIDGLEREDTEIVQSEQAREYERQQNLARINRMNTGYGSSSKFSGFDEFLNSLYKAIALQVQMGEAEEDSWTAINQRYHNSGVLKQGTKRNEIPSEKVPIIDFYFDVSGSWGLADIAMGKKAVAALSQFEQKRKIKLNIYYFSSYLSTEYSEVAGGGTNAWAKIIRNIQETRANNVVIMTDSDMNGQAGRAGQITVPGCVWYLWKNGVCASRITKDLTGKRGTSQFSFTSKDAAEAYEEERARKQAEADDE